VTSREGVKITSKVLKKAKKLRKKSRGEELIGTPGSLPRKLEEKVYQVLTDEGK